MVHKLDAERPMPGDMYNKYFEGDALKCVLIEDIDKAAIDRPLAAGWRRLPLFCCS